MDRTPAAASSRTRPWRAASRLFNGTCTRPVLRLLGLELHDRRAGEGGLRRGAIRLTVGAKLTATVERHRLPAHLRRRLRDCGSRPPRSRSRRCRPGAGRRSRGRRRPGASTSATSRPARPTANKCKGTFGTVQRAFSAAGPARGRSSWPRSGERRVLGQLVRALQLGVRPSCTHNLVVKIGVQGSLGNATDA